MRVSASAFVFAALLFAVSVATAASTGVAWKNSRIGVSAFPGTVQQVEATFVPANDLPAAVVWVTPGLAKYLEPWEPAVDPVVAGAEITVVFDLTIPVDTSVGDYAGSIHLRVGKKTVAVPLQVSVSVVAPTASSIPSLPASPSPDRLVADRDFPEQYFLADELVVGFVDGLSIAAMSKKVAAIEGVFLGSYEDLGVFQIQIADPALLDGTLALLESDPEVRLVLRHWFAPPQKVSNDPFWTSTRSPDPDWGQRMIDLPGAWDIETGSDDVTVAVIDTGYIAPHEEIQGNFTYYNRNYTSASCQRHGTKVAGVIGAEPNNNKGLAGVMWSADVQLHTVGVDRLFSRCLIDAVKAAAEMKAALRGGARVVNYSAGLGYSDSNAALKASALEEEVIRTAGAKADALFVFGAGNDSVNVNRFSPAVLATKYANVMAIAAVQQDGQLASFSNFGSGISVAAPGRDIYLLSSEKACLFCDPGGYVSDSGTSFAAPFVSGLAGLLFSYDPSLSAAEVKDLIVRGARDGGRIVPGHSFYVINAEDSLRLAGETANVVTYRFTGHVTELSADYDPALWGVMGVAPSIGSRFSGRFTYDSDVAVARIVSGLNYFDNAVKDFRVNFQGGREAFLTSSGSPLRNELQTRVMVTPPYYILNMVTTLNVSGTTTRLGHSSAFHSSVPFISPPGVTLPSALPSVDQLDMSNFFFLTMLNPPLGAQAGYVVGRFDTLTKE